MRRLLAAVFAAVSLATAAVRPPRRPKLTPAQQDATHAMFEHVIEYPDRDRPASTCRRWRNYVADQFKAGGFPAEPTSTSCPINESATTGDDDTAALIVRWRVAGNAKPKPILLMGHMDVVEAKREDWTTDPFVMTERDGYYYGRGTTDMKDGDRRHHAGDDQAEGGRLQAEARHRRPVHRRRGNQRHRRERTARREWLDLLGHPEFGLNADGGGGGFNPDRSPAGFTHADRRKDIRRATL